jgi:PAS domain S-box-containing protein
MSRQVINRETSAPDLPHLCRQVAEHSSLPTAAVEGTEHLVCYVNPAFCRLIGRTYKELIGIPFARAVPEAEVCLPLLDRVSRTGEPQTLTEQGHPESPPHWSYAVWAIPGASTRPAGTMIQVTDATRTAQLRQQAAAMNQELMLAAVRQHELLETADRLSAGLQVEIGERKRAEESLRESETQYRTLFEAIDEGFCIVEVIFDEKDKPVDYRFLETNPAFEKHTGLINAQDKRMRELVPKLEAYWFEIYGRIALTGEPARFENRAEQLDRWYDVYAFPFGRPEDRQVAILFSDITERKAMEAALRKSHEELEEKVRERTAELVQANRALRETTRTLEELIKAPPVGIWVLDPEGKVLLWNPAMEKILGWTEEEVKGKLPPTVTAGQAGAKETLERFLAGEKLAGLELHRVRKDGRPVDLLLWTAPLWEASGRLKSIVAILLDVTHLKEVERIALTQQKLASLGQVAIGVAHEIRNPLSGINLYLHSLETFLGEWEISDPELREQTEAVIAGMKGASARMEATIQRVLSFSRSGPPQMEPLDLNDCIREAVAMARISLQKAGAQVAVALQEDLPLCRGDIVLLKQALINLMTNAAQALEKQEGQRLIEISSSRVGCTSGNGYHVTVSVADSGPGIPEDVRERIFEPFFTTKELGTGIGLSITHKIVTDHGGFIKVGTSRFGGALFTIGLPTGDEGKI